MILTFVKLDKWYLPIFSGEPKDFYGEEERDFNGDTRLVSIFFIWGD